MTRFLLYSHDTYGLGHLRRSTLLADALVRSDPGHEVLIVTGSPQAQSFSLPDRVDSLKLPSATKDGAGAYQPRRLGGSIEGLVTLRSSVIMAALVSYAPDVLVVDHAPIGMAGELIPILERIACTPGGPRLVLGLRDIVDDADQVDADWQRTGIWDWLDCYDDIVVYGDPRILTTATELDLGSRVTSRVAHVGYVAPIMPEAASGVEPFLLVTPGGGGDGQALLRRYLDAVEAGATGEMRSLVVTGPLMSSRRRNDLLARADRAGSVDLIEFSDQMRSIVASASGVVSMAGYNTVVEELAAEVPAILVPRCRPRVEQDIRARRIAPHTQLQHCSLEAFAPDTVGRFVDQLTNPSATRKPSMPIDLDGASAAARFITSPAANRSSFPSLSTPSEQSHDHRFPDAAIRA